MIESKDKRIVHFMFNTGLAYKISPFAKKFKHFLQGDLQEFTEREKTALEDYAQRLINEDLEEDEKNPVVYEDSPYFSL